MPCSPWIIVGMSQNDNGGSWSAARRFLVLQYHAILFQVNSDQIVNWVQLDSYKYFNQSMTKRRLPISRFNNYQALSRPLQLASLFLPRYLKQIPDLMWVFSNIPATTFITSKIQVSQTLFSYCLSRIRIQTRAARRVVQSIKSLSSRDRSLQLIFHAPAWLVLGSVADWVPYFLDLSAEFVTSEFPPPGRTSGCHWASLQGRSGFK